MKINKKILAIIPARGGSKRLPGKNIKLFAGKSLLAYAILQAKESRYIDEVVVSTESKKIADISLKYKAQVIARPKKLATDNASVADAMLHAVSFLNKKKYFPDIVVLLQPTSPLREREDINKAIEAFIKNENKCDLVISVCESKLKEEKYPPNGAIYVMRTENINKIRSISSSKILPYFMPLEKSIDIDYEIDFKRAEQLLLKKHEIS